MKTIYISLAAVVILASIIFLTYQVGYHRGTKANDDLKALQAKYDQIQLLFDQAKKFDNIQAEEIETLKKQKALQYADLLQSLSRESKIRAILERLRATGPIHYDDAATASAERRLAKVYKSRYGTH